jgi:4,5-dihydroxyphthalate decarboxylase
MASLSLSAALTVNERTQPLLDGSVAVEGVQLAPTALEPAEIFYRQLKFAEFDVSEMSLASLMIATATAPTDWVALPVFTIRAFFHTTILVRDDAGIATPRDLRGKRVGVPEYQQTRAVWQRGILQHEFGVDAREIAWFMERTPAVSHGGATGFTPPPGIRLTYVDATTDLGALLVSGEIDAALHHYTRPNIVDRAMTPIAGHPGIRTLFADPVAEGRRYFAKTGIFPINHCVVVRRSLVARHPWLPLNLYAAFAAAKARTIERRAASMEPLFAVGALPPGERAAATFDAFPYGLSGSRAVVETIAAYLFEQGLTPRVVAPDELFAASTMAL